MLRGSWPIIAIVLVAVVVRTWGLTTFPPSLNWDEVSLGYNAYSLLHTGRDEWGMVLPSIFRAFGDFKLPVYVYLAVPLQALLGQTEIAIRLVSVLAGVLTVLVVYRLGGKWAALVTAIIPWTVFLSRIALEANVAVLLLSLGLTLLLKRKLTLAVMFFGLSMWTYNSCRVFVPLFLVGYYWFNRTKIRLSWTPVVIAAIFFIPMVWQLINPTGQARYQTLTLLDQGAILRINDLRSRPGGRLVYNKVTYWGYLFFTNYLSYFNPGFLFFKGGSHYQFSIPGTGLVYVTFLPFIILGLIAAVKNYKNLGWLWLWLLLYPVAGSITRDSPHTLRAMVILPILPLLFTKGMAWLKINYRWAGLVLVVLLLGEVIHYGYKAMKYSQDYSWTWQYGNKQLVQYIKANYHKYDQIIVTKRYGEPHEFLAYYWPWKPRDFQLQKQWDYHASWYWVNSLDKIAFVNDWEVKDHVAKFSESTNYLVVYSPESEGPGASVLRINFLSGQPAYILKEL